MSSIKPCMLCNSTRKVLMSDGKTTYTKDCPACTGVPELEPMEKMKTGISIAKLREANAEMTDSKLKEYVDELERNRIETRKLTLRVDEPTHKAYQVDDEPENLHFIKSGFSQPQLWLYFREDAYSGHTDITALTVEQIKQRFNIDIC